VKKGGEVANIFAKTFKDDFRVEEFPEMSHGWLTMGDISQDAVKRDTRKTIQNSEEFFLKFPWLSSSFLKNQS